MSTLTRIGLGIGALAMTTGLAVGGYASTQDANGPRRRFMEGRGGPGGAGGPLAMLGPRMAARLNLSDAQKDQVKSIADSHREELQGLAGRAGAARQALHGAVTADVLDEGLIRARAADLAAVESDLAVARARVHGELFRILTPDQQAQAKDAQARMQERRSDRRERGSRRPSPPR